MLVLDEKFRKNKLRYVLQCLLATVAVGVLLTILDAISDAAVIGALGASSFIAFTMPHANVSRARFLIGGHCMGVVAGMLCHWASRWPVLAEVPLVSGNETVLFGALAVGLAIFLMVTTDTEHPPAAGVALGLVLEQRPWGTVAVILVGVVVLALMRRALQRWLLNLL